MKSRSVSKSLLLFAMSLTALPVLGQQSSTARLTHALQDIKGSDAPITPNGTCTAITDNGYVTPTAGTTGMTCVTVAGGAGTVNNPSVLLGLDHTWIGDLTVKLVPPAGTPVITLLSRPGRTGGTGAGDSTNLISSSVLEFSAANSDDPETMGNTLDGAQFVCQDDGRCSYTTNPDEEAAGVLSDLNGTSSAGSWQICVGDGAALDTGQICSADVLFSSTAADVSVAIAAPDGVAVGGTYLYDVTASNAGPDAATGVVATVTLPGDVNFVSSNCGATAVGGTVTWNIGTLANGGSQSCSLTVELAGSVCVAVSATATIDVTEGDPAAGNNTASAANGGGNSIADPSFEDGTPNGFWTESSTNFGTPLCDAGCGTGGGTAGPRTGAWWAWFGGSSATETATTGQSVTIPAGSTTLDFYFEAPVCSATAGAADFIRLTIDGVEQWREDTSSASCNVDGWQLVSIPVTTFADGNSHAILFESTSGTAGETTNFMVDDVSLASAPTCVAGNTLPDPVPQPAVIPASNGKTLGLMALLLGMVGFAVMRRRD